MPNKALKNSLESRIGRHVTRCDRGMVFTPATFAGWGSRAAIDKALQRLVAKGVLRRLSRGWYDKPRTDDRPGPLWPSVESVVKALVGKEKSRVQPAGLYAANLLGLSEQVPARIVLLTDGTGRSVRIGPMQLILKRTSPRNMAAAGRLSGLVIQALKSLGAQHITPEHLALLRARLPAFERARLVADEPLAPGWMQPILHELARPDPFPAEKLIINTLGNRAMNSLRSASSRYARHGGAVDPANRFHALSEQWAGRHRGVSKKLD